MDVKTSALSKVTWLQILGLRADDRSMICLHAHGPAVRAASWSAIVLRPVPMLDWPVGLFEDTGCYN